MTRLRMNDVFPTEYCEKKNRRRGKRSEVKRREERERDVKRREGKRGKET